MSLKEADPAHKPHQGAGARQCAPALQPSPAGGRGPGHARVEGGRGGHLGPARLHRWPLRGHPAGPRSRIHSLPAPRARWGSLPAPPRRSEPSSRGGGALSPYLPKTHGVVHTHAFVHTHGVVAHARDRGWLASPAVRIRGATPPPTHLDPGYDILTEQLA